LKKQRIKDNFLFHYFILSLTMTTLIAIVLSTVLVKQMKNHMILSHSYFYQAYIKAIPNNYSEILPFFSIKSGTKEKIQDGHPSDLEAHESEAHPDNEWAHFQNDLLQYPAVVQLRIFNNSNEIIWHYGAHQENQDPVSIDTIRTLLIKNPITYQIKSTKPDFIIHYYIPLFINGEMMGIVEVSDQEPKFGANLVKNRNSIVSLILLSGLVFFVSLFYLFFRGYTNQRKSLERLDQSQSLTIHTMSRLAELRDNNTGAHIQRTSLYCKALCSALKTNLEYKSYITKEYIEDLVRSAPLHDIGKVGIPDHILQKPGKLTAEEFEIIKSHPKLGAEVLKVAIESLGFQSFFEIGYQIVLSHHENWDGSGYPNGLVQKEIPLSARIMAIADVYDALTTTRPYKNAFSHEKAMSVILEESGNKFDPIIVEALIQISDEFKLISESNSASIEE
jgi:HD-GYP domain-containing protein (c-di-GMP phosphodiesterase class II)